MSERSRAWLSAHGPDPDLAVMVGVSAVLHLVTAALLYWVPREIFAPSPPPVVAYTVKIVDPNALGGRLPRGPMRPEREASAALPATEKAPEPPKPPEAAPPKPPQPPPKAEEPKRPAPEPKPEPNGAKAVTIPSRTAPTPKPTAAPARAAAAEPSAAAADEARRRREKDELDRKIQEAVRRIGERGRGNEAAGLGGTEEGKGAALGVGGEGGGGGILTGLDFILYKNQVEGIIKRNWTWVGTDPNLTVRVGFRIRQDGEIVDLRILQSSGDASYDQSVLQAIRASSPLPPPPEKYRDVFGDYRLDFVSGNLQSRGPGAGSRRWA